jgi:hypothetical protein
MLLRDGVVGTVGEEGCGGVGEGLGHGGDGGVDRGRFIVFYCPSPQILEFFAEIEGRASRPILAWTPPQPLQPNLFFLVVWGRSLFGVGEKGKGKGVCLSGLLFVPDSRFSLDPFRTGAVTFFFFLCFIITNGAYHS